MEASQRPKTRGPQRRRAIGRPPARATEQGGIVVVDLSFAYALERSATSVVDSSDALLW